MDKVPLPRVYIPELSGHVHHISVKKSNNDESKKFWCSVGTEKNFKFKELVKCLADLSGRQFWLVSHEVYLLEEINFFSTTKYCVDIKFRKFHLKLKKNNYHYGSYDWGVCVENQKLPNVHWNSKTAWIMNALSQ